MKIILKGSYLTSDADYFLRGSYTYLNLNSRSFPQENSHFSKSFSRTVYQYAKFYSLTADFLTLHVCINCRPTDNNKNAQKHVN